MQESKPLNRTGWLLCVGLALFVFLSAFFHVSDVDVGYHMRTAMHILAGNGIPTTNTFSSTTPGEPWLLHQWLGAILFYLPYRIGGVEGLVAFKALAATALMLLVWGAARRLTGPDSPWPWWTVTLGALVARVRFFERSDLLSGLFCALVLFLDVRLGPNRRWQWLGLPLLMAAWANIHAGVVYGVVLLGAWSAGEWISWFWSRVRKPVSGTRTEPGFKAPALRELWVRPAGILLSLLAAALSVQLINPNGCKVLWFPISQFNSPFWQSIILEYRPPDWNNYKLFYLSLGSLVVLQLLTWRRVRPTLLIASMVFAYLACSSQRSLLFFVIVAMPHMACMLNELSAPATLRAPRMSSWLLPGLWLAIVLLWFAPDKTLVFGAGFYRPYYPLDIYGFLKTEVPEQNLFNEMRYGGSMLWWLYPKFKPFIDGRGDAYSERFWRTEYIPVIKDKPYAEDILKKYSVHGALLPVYEDRTLPPIAPRLHAHPDWALVAFNDHTLLFLERTAANQPVIARHEYRLLWPGDWSLAALDAPETRAEATAEAKRAFEFAPDSFFAETALARAFFVNEQYAAVVEILRGVVREKDIGANYLRDFGYALFRLGRLEEADQVFARLIRRNLLPGFAWYLRSFIASEQGRSADARNCLAAAIKAEPGNAEYRDALQRLDREAPRRQPKTQE